MGFVILDALKAAYLWYTKQEKFLGLKPKAKETWINRAKASVARVFNIK
jgi:hypothetical protein